MKVTIAEAKAFVAEVEKTRAQFIGIANASWNEIKNRQTNGSLFAQSLTQSGVYRGRTKARYPAWYSIYKIRQSLVFARLGIPLCRDTTQDGNDTIGATAAILRERLAVNLAKTFPFFDELCANRDDALVTNFTLGRAYYERDEVRERVKELITPQKTMTPEGNEEVVFLDSNGKEIETDDIMQDDEGWFIYKNQIVDVENERICYNHMLYSDCLIDPCIKRWNRCKRLAFKNYYSEPEFKEIFGVAAFLDLATQERHSEQSGAAKRQDIAVYEYWDYYAKECFWFAENGSDFIKPKKYMIPEGGDDYGQEALNGLYNLDKFFPCPPPFIMNAPTDEFWPVPEYYQLMGVFEEIHTIFGRMMETTRAYRARLLFDSAIPGLKKAINESPEGGATGVSNLTQALVQAGGDLRNVAQYIPTEGIIASLQQLYISLEQRLNMIYRLTGTSDMLQGLAADQTMRTFGERQMTEKYALNQLEEPQRKMAEYVRDCYELITEMALKNFKDASLDLYCMPQTLQPEQQQQYLSLIHI
jgi:hypothetical protein